MKLIIDGHGTERTIYPSREVPLEKPAPEPLTYTEALGWNKHFQQERQREMVYVAEYAKVRRDPTIGNRIYAVNLSDLHWGDADVDYDYLNNMLDMVEYTPDTYGVLGWNIIDAAIPSQFPDGLLWNSMTAQGQLYTFRDRLKRMTDKDKILASIGDASCHEGWLKKHAGWMVYKELFEGIDVPLLQNGAYLDVETGGETYRMALFHKTRYWSTLNKPHSGERAMDRISNAEIVFTSHMHRAATSETTRYNPPFNKDTAVVSSGTTKLKDRWLRSIVGEAGEPAGQGIFLWADKHQFETVYHFERGREMILDQIKNKDAKEIERLRGELAKLK